MHCTTVKTTRKIQYWTHKCFSSCAQIRYMLNCYRHSTM